MAFDEMSGDAAAYGADVRESYRGLARWLAEAPEGLLQSRSRQAELFFRRMGITFAVYGDAESSERLIPFDVVPRIIGAAEWAGLEAGLVQRVRAINLFLADIYGPQECLKAGVLPSELVLTNPHYAPEMQGRRPPRGAGCVAPSRSRARRACWQRSSRRSCRAQPSRCRRGVPLRRQ